MTEEKKKKKGFGCLTIIVIGIILFIIFSFTVYNVHTSGMKKAFEKARPGYVAKDFKRLAMIIKSEERSCINGSKYLINELLLCDERTPEKIIKALIKTLEINNSIDSSDIPNRKIIVYDNNTYFQDKKTLRISKNNTSQKALLEAVRNPKLKPWNPIYLFFTADMTGKYGAISKLGSWDIANGGSKPRGYQNLACNKTVCSKF